MNVPVAPRQLAPETGSSTKACTGQKQGGPANYQLLGLHSDLLQRLSGWYVVDRNAYTTAQERCRRIHMALNPFTSECLANDAMETHMTFIRRPIERICSPFSDVDRKEKQVEKT